MKENILIKVLCFCIFYRRFYNYQDVSRLTDEEIKIFVKENTNSETFCMEEDSEKYTIVV